MQANFSEVSKSTADCYTVRSRETFPNGTLRNAILVTTSDTVSLACAGFWCVRAH